MVIKSGHMTRTMTELHRTNVYVDEMVAWNSYILQSQNYRNGLEQSLSSDSVADIVRTDQRFTQMTDWQRPQEGDFNSAGNKERPPPCSYSSLTNCRFHTQTSQDEIILGVIFTIHSGCKLSVLTQHARSTRSTSQQWQQGRWGQEVETGWRIESWVLLGI